MSAVARTQGILKKRIGRFVGSKAYARDEVLSVINAAKRVGEVAIFGGMLRDLSLEGNEGFCSDVDLVVRTADPHGLDEVLKSFSPARNRFGGYRIALSRWKVDIWEYGSTWAFREGHVKGSDFADLCKTTFFDWDAVVYEVSTAQLHTIDDYLERLGSSTVDINLEPNPNPSGTAVRILRLLAKRNAKLTPRLTAYLVKRIQENSVADICAAESRSYDKRMLSKEFVAKVKQLLSSHPLKLPSEAFGLGSEQLGFDFGENANLYRQPRSARP
jgi:predicted nucleotidyltransferase